jgi:hypothetical protein
MQRDVKSESGIVPSEEPREEHQVSGAGNGQKFGQSLNRAEDKGL